MSRGSSDRPDLAGDVLSDVLKAVRLSGVVFFDVDAAVPWVAEAPAARVLAPAVLPEAEHVIEYHVVTSGACWASVIGHDSGPIRLTAGDVVAFPHGDAHVLSSAPGMRATPDTSVLDQPAQARQLPLMLNLDGGGAERAHLVCGFLGCDSRPFNPLLGALPPVLHLEGKSARGAWLREFTRFAVLEANDKRAGADGILAKLGEIMFAELLRHYIEALPPASGGWLAGQRDPQVGRALNLLHAQPTRPWTLAQLAREVGMSRSSLSERFTQFVGVAPIQYLKRWRLQIAAARLREGRGGIAAIAADIGYESEAAFSRAFKKTVGLSPAEWRDRKGPAGR